MATFLHWITGHPCSETPSILEDGSLRCHLPSCGRNGRVGDRGRGVESSVCPGDTGGATLWKVTPPRGSCPLLEIKARAAPSPDSPGAGAGGPRQILQGLDWFLIS